MVWLSLLDEVGSDVVALLAIAELAGMSVTTDGDKLVIRGHRDAEAIAEQMLANKPAVMHALSVYVYATSANTEKNLDCVDVDSPGTRDEWSFLVEPHERLIDVVALTACPQCGSLEKWWPAIGEPRCQSCDPPRATWRLLECAEAIRTRLGIAVSQPRVVTSEPHCPKCLTTEFRDTPIHGGQSVRRDCAKCGRFIGFPIWYGHRMPET